MGARTVIITGASRGIGRACALEFAKQGDRIAVIYKTSRELAESVCKKALDAGASSARAYMCDVASFSECGQTVEKITAELGTAEVLINNAGVVCDSLLLRMTEDDFDAVLAADLKSVFNMTKSCLPPMLKTRRGRIINISSVVGLSGNVAQANYAAAKAGVIGFTKSAAKEAAHRGVTINAVAPGFIQTEMTSAIGEKALDRIMSSIPLKRAGAPEEVAGLCAFLASPAAGYITGEVIRIDGGLAI